MKIRVRRVRHERRAAGGLPARRAAAGGAGRAVERRQVEPDQRARAADDRAHERGARQDPADQPLSAVDVRSGFAPVDRLLPGRSAGLRLRRGGDRRGAVRRADERLLRPDSVLARRSVGRAPARRCPASRAAADLAAWTGCAVDVPRRRRDEDRQARARGRARPGRMDSTPEQPVLGVGRDGGRTGRPVDADRKRCCQQCQGLGRERSVNRDRSGQRSRERAENRRRRAERGSGPHADRASIEARTGRRPRRDAERPDGDRPRRRSRT